MALATGALTAGSLVLVLACTSESVTGVDIGSVSVSPSSSVVMEGLRVQFDATVYDAEGAALPTAVVLWSSDDPSVASVDEGGLATGVAMGETTIRASFNGSAGSAGLTVQPGPSVGVAPPSATLHGGASGPPPDPVILGLTQEGGGSVGALSVTVAYPAGAPTGWLTAALSTTTLPADLTLGAAPGALSVGKHRATVSVAWSSGGEAGGVSIPVTLSLTAFTATQTEGGTRVTEAGTTDSVRVVLESAPASDVRLLVTSADPGEVTASPTVLTFTPTTWAAPQSVTVTGVDDREIDGDQTTIVTITVDDARSDPAYRPALDRSVSVETIDDDAASFSVSETAVGTAVTESGTSDSLAVVLDTRPSSNVVITVTASDPGEATAAPTVLTFRPVDWDVPRTVTVTGVDDDVVDGSQTSTLTLAVDVDRSDATYRDVPDATVTVVTTDDDGAGLSISQSQGSTVVTEAGSTDVFTAVLTAQPSGDVVVLVTSADIGEATVGPSTLTFTSADWSTAQPVSVRGVDDDVVDGAVVTSVTIEVDQARSAPEYGGAAPASVAVTTLDDDVAGFTVVESDGSTAVSESGTSDTFTVVLGAQPTTNVVFGVGSGDAAEVSVFPTSLSFTPGNWGQPQTVTVTGVDDDVVDGSQTSTLTLAVDVDRSDATYRDVPDATVTVVTTDDDGAGLSISQSQGSTVVTEAGSTDVFTAVLTAQPSGDVVVLVTSADVGEATVGPSTITFTPADWSTAQPVSVRGVDDDVVDGAVVTSVTIEVDQARSAPEYGGAAPASVAVTTLDDDVAGFTVVESDGSTAVSESGTSDTFTVVLGAQPTTNVVFRVGSGDAAEVSVSPTTLSFTPGNWGQPQTVTVTGVDDDVADGSRETPVTITVDTAASDDTFDALTPQSVDVTTTDDDESGFTITTGAVVSIPESGGTAPLTVVLDTQPSSPVRLTFVSLDPLVATVAPAELTFTPSVWSTPQSVTVSAVNDEAVGGDRLASVLVAIDESVSDDGFDGIANQTVQVTVVDDDSAGFALADTAGLTVSEAGGTDAFTVVLDSSPSSNVVLAVSGADVGEVTVSPATLTFTSTNWGTPQAVTLTGVDEAVVDGPQVTSVTVSVVDALSQDAFDGLVATTAVTTTDDDEAGIALADTTGLTVTEAGTTDAFTVALTAAPVSNVVLSVVSGDVGEVTASPVSLTFTGTDWNVPRAVSLGGVDDAVADGDRQTVITVAVDDAQSDAAFAGLSTAARATTTDDDTVGVAVSVSELTVAEGGPAATFDVRLDSEPTQDVVVSVQSLDAGEVAVTPGSLTFSPSAWSVPQNVTVTGVLDATVDGDQQTQVLIAVDALSSDPAYAAVPAREVTVTTTDVDATPPTPVRP